jgi:group II intron reverse transcriptase/maturase
MRDADTILGIIHERGKARLPLEDIYRQLYNPQLYLRAYDRIRRNEGAMTPGVTAETVDSMSLEKIMGIIEAVRHERYRWTPVRRVYIPKKSGKLRPLGMPTWSDKLLQEVIRSILEAYYEPQFSPASHGFRPDRGCHTALAAVQQWWGMKWFIEGDISKCFDMLDHQVLMRILGEKLHDNRFLRLIENTLKAGYLEEWRWNATHSGSPQGGVISPILSNIYLDRLDQYVTTTLIPGINRGKKRAENLQYAMMTKRVLRAKEKGDKERHRQLVLKRRTLPSVVPDDPDFRRLRYVRYADDFLLAFVGPKAEAEEIKRQLRGFLRDELKLELSDEKTLITHAHEEAAKFLGYEISISHADDKLTRNKRSVNGAVILRVPQDVIAGKRAAYMEKGKPIHRRELVNDSDFAILVKYQAEYRGVVQYYILAHNVARLGYLHHTMQTSLTKTLANKHKTSVQETMRRYATTITTAYGTMKCLKVEIPRDGKPPLVAQFGGIPRRRKKTAVLSDVPILPPRHWRATDVVKRLLADSCELCGSKVDIQVHHIRKLADLHKGGRREKPLWMKTMAAKRRKTLVVCQSCHSGIHAGKPRKQGVELESRIP